MAKNRIASGAQSASKTVVWIILLLVIVGLGGYSVAGFGRSIRSIGSVGDTEIPTARYGRQLSQDLRAFSAQVGSNVTMEQAAALGLDRAALGKVLDQVALENEAQRIGLSVGDAEVRRQLMLIPDFQGFDGKFDDAAYRDTLKRNNLSVAGFERQLRAEASRLLLARGVVTGTTMPPTYVDTLYRWAGERRSFDWAELTEDDLATPIPAATEAELKAWYDAHNAAYTEPEKKAITYAWITPLMLTDKIPPDEAALKQLYADKADDYVKPERRLVERLVFGTGDEAKAAWDRLQKGEVSFDALVTERGLKLEDIDMGDVSKADLGAAGDAVFALTEPGEVGPVETSLGPAILRMNGILPAETVSYEEARPELLEAWASDRARKQISAMMEEVNDLLAGGATLEDVADQTDLELGQVDFSDEVSDGIAGYNAFRKAVAEVKEGDFPEAMALDDGGLFALRLDKVIPPALQPLETVRDRVAADWRDDQVRSALGKMADELIPRIEAGEDPGSFGLTVNREDLLKRDAFLADVPEGLVTTAFSLAPGKAARIAGTAGTPTIAIVRTTAVEPPDPADADLKAARDNAAGQLNQQLARDLLDAFTKSVEQTAGVHIDAGAVNAVNAQFN